MHTLDKHFRTLTGAAFQRHGFAQADILSHWHDIIGPQIASLCTPDRISWPRQGQLGNTRGATLSVKAFAGCALDVQYAIPQILERLNSFLGHGAINHVKISPSQIVRNPIARPARDETITPAILAKLSEVNDEPLQAALGRLGVAVCLQSPRAPRSPQVK